MYGKRLKKRREDLGFSQTEVAEAINKRRGPRDGKADFSYVSRIERFGCDKPYFLEAMAAMDDLAVSIAQVSA